MIQKIDPVRGYTLGNTYTSIFHANKSDGLPKHDHAYPHITVCFSGSIIVRKQGKELVMTKQSQPLYLVENEWHEIEALEDGTVFVNVFSAGKN